MVDVVVDGNAFYARWDARFDMKLPGFEGVIEGNGIIHVVLKEGKVLEFTSIEDPTPFVAMATAMAAKGQVA